MKRSGRFLVLVLVLILACPAFVGAQGFSDRFAKGSSTFSGQLGMGYTVQIPPGRSRTDLSFAWIFPNWQYNLTGIMAEDSFLRGALFWHVEAGMAVLTHRDNEYLVGFSPLMAEYKFLSPKRRWAPTVVAGAGFSMTNWKDQAVPELGSEFEFLLHLGAGVEVFRKLGSYSLNYRFFHVSNAGMQRPNIGLNTNVFSLGMSF
ncbi:MAG: hypothetical protein CMH77_04080 [Nitrospinae bacterium]|nr:hypothetical protein [Nitrospinota bacterium]